MEDLASLEPSNEMDQRTRDRRDIIMLLIISLGIGVIGIVAYTIARYKTPWVACSGALLISSSAMIVGFLIGFLFGMPKALDQSSKPSDKQTEDTGANTPFYWPNTNLYQISDWLTKILVGLGLTQIGNIGEKLLEISGIGASLLGGLDNVAAPPAMQAGALQIAVGHNQAVALTFIVYFLIAGFLTGYLVTSTILSETLVRTAMDIIQPKARSLLLGMSFSVESLGKGEASGAHGRKTVPLDKNTEKAVKDITKIPLEKLERTEDLIAWARAQALIGNNAKALEAYKILLSRNPYNPELRQEHASLLSALQDSKGAISEFQTALDQADATTSKVSESTLRKTKAKSYEGLMFNHLYRHPPEGFEEVIKTGEMVTKELGLTNVPSIWVYLACAYGQKYQWLKDHAVAEELDSVRRLALQAAETAIRLDNSAKGWMRSLWDGSDSLDNDLTVFREDPEFKKLLSET